MDKNTLIKHLLNKKVQNYGFIVAFLIIFSFFIIFIIKPNISLVFQLGREKDYLDKLDRNYENTIINIVNLQSEMEKVRPNLDIINQALPNQVGIDLAVDDLRKSASSSAISIKKLSFSSFSLINKVNDKKLKKIEYNLEFTSDFVKTMDFIKTVLKQRRLKNIDQIIIDRPTNSSTESADLNIKVTGDIFYL